MKSSSLLTGALTLAVVLVASPSSAQSPEPLRVVASTPNVGALCRAVGGDLVDVTVLARASQDPHFVNARPGHVTAVARADVLVVVGLDLEIAWIPAVIDSARNPEVRIGRPGYVDLSAAIRPLGIPTTPADRSLGDVHPRGNPHYLVDPVSQLAAAEFLATRLAKLRPAAGEALEARVAAFHARLGALLVGAELAERFDGVKLARLVRHGKLTEYLDGQEDAPALGGLMARAVAHVGEEVVVDHNGWPYLTQLLGLETVGMMEPRPGIPPTTRHLAELVESAKALHARALLVSPYFDQRSIGFVADNAGLRIARLAHQVGAVDGVETLEDLVRHNVAAILAALASE